MISMLGILVFLVVAAAWAWIAQVFTPGKIPGGFAASALVGIIGAWIGTSLFGHFGPQLGGISVIPAILGAALLELCLSLFAGLRSKGTV